MGASTYIFFIEIYIHAAYTWNENLMYFYTVVLPPQGYFWSSMFSAYKYSRWRFTDLIRPMWNQCVSPPRSGGRVWSWVRWGFCWGWMHWESRLYLMGDVRTFFSFLNDCALILSLCGETINDDFNVRLVTSYALYPAVVTHISHSVIIFSNFLKIMPPPPTPSSVVMCLVLDFQHWYLCNC